MAKRQILDCLPIQADRGGTLCFWSVAFNSASVMLRKIAPRVEITSGKITTCCNKNISEPGKLTVAVEGVGGKVQVVQVLPLDQVPGWNHYYVDQVPKR